MPKYIDADALIFSGRICGNCRDRELCDGYVAFCPSASARRAIYEAPTVEVEPDKGWISVKDRLPECDGLYIVCKTVEGHQICFEARWRRNEWLSVVNDNQLDYISHWQPLPEPPKEVQDDESL